MSSRKEEKEQRRAERLARESREAEAARRRRTYSIVVGGALAIAAIAAVVVAVAAGGGGGDGATHEASLTGSDSFEGAADPPAAAVTELEPAARAAGCRLQNPVIEGRTHLAPGEEPPDYKTNPPTSGNHDLQPTGDGAFDRQPPERNLIHTLEHGRVEFHYDPDLPQQRINQLGGLFNEDPYHIVLTPNRTMPYQVAGSGWGHLIGCRRITDKTFDALRAFRDKYRDQGPEQVP